MIRLFSVFIPTTILALLISEIVLISLCYGVALTLQGTISWQSDPSYIWFYMANENGTLRLAILTASILVGLYLNDCYTRPRIHSFLVFAQQLCVVIGGAFMVQALLSYSQIPDSAMPRQSMFMGSSLIVFALPLWRVVFTKVSLQLLGAERILFVGIDPLQFKIAAELVEHPEFAMAPLGFFTETPVSDDRFKGNGITTSTAALGSTPVATSTATPSTVAIPSIAGVPVLGDLSTLPVYLRSHKVDRIVIGLNQDDDASVLQSLQHLDSSRYRIDSVSNMHELIFGRVAVAQLKPIQIVFKNSLVPSELMLKIQAIYSFVVALITLILFSPLMIASALAVRLSSKGPVLYRQVRTGRNNHPFTLFKFRSMYIDAEAATGAVWAQENDPRVTRVGRVLRKYRLDELPQLFNVLRNEMAIVGPRPERPEFVNILTDQIPFYNHRHSVKPGITGWAQINYRYGNTLDDTIIKLEYDLYYIKNFSPQLDLYVMFHTVKTMLLTRGAY